MLGELITATLLRFKKPTCPTDTTLMYGKIDQVDLLSKLLDVTSVRHRVIANNVANINTPGFHRVEVNFEDALAQALTGRSEGKALKIQPQLVQPTGDPERVDGNNVDIDAEMGKLEQNTLLYKVYAQVLAGQIASMRSAISGH
jgi:flagellar basal-body rod protein FlgB